MKQQKSLVTSIILGLLIAVVGIGVWGFVSYQFGIRAGLIGIAIGFLVGKTLGKSNNNDSIVQSIIAVVITAASIYLGEVFAVILMASKELAIGIAEVVKLIDFSLLPIMIFKSFDPKSFLIYGFSLLEELS